MQELLTDKVVVIVGGTSGLGAGIARAAVREGASVVATGRRPEPGEALVDELGESVSAVTGDVSDPEQATGVVAAAIERHGRIDCLVNCAGLTDRVIGQSFWPSTVASLQKVAPDLRRGLLVAETSEDLLAVCAELGVMTCNPAGTVLLAQPGLVAELHDAGLEVMVWTLNEPEQWALALEIGVDAVITDRPDRLRGWLAGR